MLGEPGQMVTGGQVFAAYVDSGNGHLAQVLSMAGTLVLWCWEQVFTANIILEESTCGVDVGS